MAKPPDQHRSFPVPRPPERATGSAQTKKVAPTSNSEPHEPAPTNWNADPSPPGKDYLESETLRIPKGLWAIGSAFIAIFIGIQAFLLVVLQKYGDKLTELSVNQAKTAQELTDLKAEVEAKDKHLRELMDMKFMVLTTKPPVP